MQMYLTTFWCSSLSLRSSSSLAMEKQAARTLLAATAALSNFPLYTKHEGSEKDDGNSVGAASKFLLCSVSSYCLMLGTSLHLFGSLACVPITSKSWGCLDLPIFDSGERGEKVSSKALYRRSGVLGADVCLDLPCLGQPCLGVVVPSLLNSTMSLRMFRSGCWRQALYNSFK